MQNDPQRSTDPTVRKMINTVKKSAEHVNKSQKAKVNMYQ